MQDKLIEILASLGYEQIINRNTAGDTTKLMSPRLNKIKSICVFCGSGLGKNPAFKTAAIDLGKTCAEHDINIIYGGGDMGLMGTLAKSAMENGGTVTGIIPEFLLKYQSGCLDLSQQIITQSMHERKAKMHQLADGFIALPGGIGTLEELVETMTWEQLGQHTKPIFLLNVKQFWTPFLNLLSHMQNEQFIRDGLEVNFNVVDTVEDLMQAIKHLNKKVTVSN